MITLGKDTTTHLPVLLSDAARRLSTYVMGIKGMGKSTLLEGIAAQDIARGEGLCFIDPHGDSADVLRDTIYRFAPHRVGDIVFWDIADSERPFGLNPFYCSNEKDLGRVAEAFVPALESLEEFRLAFDNAPRMREVLSNIAYTFVVNQGYTLAQAPKFLENREYRKRFYPKLERRYPQGIEFWKYYDSQGGSLPHPDFAAPLNKLRRFQRGDEMRGIFGQPITSINFREAMDNGKIIIIKFSDIGEGNAEFVGAFVVLELWRAIYSRINVPMENLRPFHIIADEFHAYTTKAFYKIQDQGRKAEVDVVIAHQHRSQIHDTQMEGSTRAVGNKILLRVSGGDGKDFACEFKQETPLAPTRQQQRFALVSNVLEHLTSRGHTDTDIIALSRSIQYIIDRLFAYAIEHQEQEMAVSAQMRLLKTVGEQREREEPIPPSAPASLYGQRMQLARSQIERGLDEILFAMMSAQDAGNVERLWQPDGKAKLRFTQLVDDIYAYLFSQVDRQNVARERQRASVVVVSQTNDLIPLEAPAGTLTARDPGSFIWQRTALLWEWETVLGNTVYQLGRALWKDPCRERTGQIEEVPERARPLSDVEAELANRLSNLPRFRAYVTITPEGADAEPMVSTITILERLGPLATDASRDVGQQIVQASRKQYGRDRDQVEVEIRERLEKPPEALVKETTQEQPISAQETAPAKQARKKRVVSMIE